MQQATLNVGTAKEIAARVADDPRADGGRRMVLLDSRCVTIRRRVQGMKMLLSVPVESYRGVAIGCEKRPEGVVYRISLAHSDPDLCVTLKETCDGAGVLDAWRRWAAFFKSPRLVERAVGEWELVGPAPRGAKAGACPLPRRLTALAKPSLRRRRAPADAARLSTVFRGEREIICYE